MIKTGTRTLAHISPGSVAGLVKVALDRVGLNTLCVGVASAATLAPTSIYRHKLHTYIVAARVWVSPNSSVEGCSDRIWAWHLAPPKSPYTPVYASRWRICSGLFRCLPSPPLLPTVWLKVTHHFSSRLGSNRSLLLVPGREVSPMTSFYAETDLKSIIVSIIMIISGEGG